MRNRTQSTQAEHTAFMATMFPELYRAATAEELAVIQRPISGMLFSIDQEVSHYLTRRTGTVEGCTQHLDGRRKYTIAWADGRRTLEWETDVRAVEGGR